MVPDVDSVNGAIGRNYDGINHATTLHACVNLFSEDPTELGGTTWPMMIGVLPRVVPRLKNLAQVIVRAATCNCLMGQGAN